MKVQEQMKKISYFIYLIAKDKRPNKNKTLNPRPNYTVKTNKAHYGPHGNKHDVSPFILVDSHI